MKNNKGLSLVELLVAMVIIAILMIEVVNLMTNCSQLYRKGASEVNLQAESQRVIQVMEEMMIDCNISINAVPITPSINDIYVSTNTVSQGEVTYKFYLEKADPADIYGNLMLDKTVSGSTATSVLAEYVESISLNMANYNTGDKVTLSVSMKNDDYTYSTISVKDIYLRNMIGTHGNARKTNLTAATYTLDCLRCKTYDLYDEFSIDSSYSFEFSSDTATEAVNNYSLNSSGKLKSLHDNAFDKDVSCKIVIKDAAGAEKGTINVFTYPVRISLGKNITTAATKTAKADSVVYFNANKDGEANAVCYSYIDFQGIYVGFFDKNDDGDDPDDGNSEIASCTAKVDNGKVQADGESESDSFDLAYDTEYNSFRAIAPDYNNSKARFDKIKWYIDKDTNSVVISAGKWMPETGGDDDFKNAIDNLKYLYFYVDLERDGIKLESNGYIAPMVKNGYNSQTFWDNVGDID